MARAEKKGLTLTAEVETLLQQALNGVDRGAYPELALAPGGEYDPVTQKALALCDGLSFFFDRQIAAFAIAAAFVMQDAALDSAAWSGDVVKRTRRFPEVKPGTGASWRQVSELGQFLRKSLTGFLRPFDDPYVFSQARAAVDYIFEMIAPVGDPSLPPVRPRGIDPEVAERLMRNMGEVSSDLILRTVTGDDVDKLPPEFLLIRAWLGEAELARLRQRLSAESPSQDPTDGEQSQDG